MNEHALWIPSRYISLWSGFGLEMYVMMTWLAIAAGTIWWTSASWKLTDALWKRAMALVVIAVVTIFFTRLFHILFWGWQQTIDHPSLLTQLKSGRSIHGALAGFTISAIIISRVWKIPLEKPADILSFWPVFGLICARIGNFWNSEMIGTPSDLPFALRFYFSGDHGGIPRHPVQLYEAGLATVLLAIMVAAFMRKTKRRFLLPSLALIGYSVIRFGCDFIKDDPGHLFGEWLTTGQVLSILFIAAGVFLLREPGADPK